jgi:outer membrane beta-barrel protein
MTGVLNYHFTESLGLEVDGSFGLSLDKEDKGILKKSPTAINTTILRTQYQMLGGLVWTPLYGKYQLASGRLIYFDTFLIGGGGLTGIDYQYDHCIKSPSGRTADPPAPQTKSYVGGMIGIGQRFFLDKSLSLRFEVRDNFFSVDSRDGSCDPEFADSKMETTNNITMQFGASKFL